MISYAVSGLATGSSNGLHPKSKFLAASNVTVVFDMDAYNFS